MTVAANGRSKVHVLLSIRTLTGAGAELVVETLTRGLDSRYFDVTVCEGVGRGEKGDRLRSLGFDVVSFVPDGNPRKSYANFLRLRRLVAVKRIDVIHSHSATALTDAALCKLLSPRLKVVHTFHFGNYPAVPPSIARLERTFGRLADVRVAVGHGQEAAIRATYGLEAGQIRTIWNGIPRRPVRIDQERLAPIRARGGVLIGMVGTLTEQKGHADMFETAQLLRQRGVPHQLVVAGGGRLRTELEQRCRALGLTDSITFLGWVHDAAETILPGIDIFFQPSRWEAMSMVLLEAAALAKPIVCTDVGEASRILEHGTHALMVAPRDARSMADALERLIANPDLRREMGEAARARVEACCMADSMVRRYEELYMDVTARPTLRAAAAS